MIELMCNQPTMNLVVVTVIVIVAAVATVCFVQADWEVQF
jgi:hypothetical protein